MTQIVIATHGDLATGLKMSTEFIMGEQPNLHAIPAYTDECVSVEKAIQDIISAYPEDELVVITDILGGSVNTEVNAIIHDRSNAYQICGANLPLIIQLLINLQSTDTAAVVAAAIKAGKEGILNFKEYEDNQATTNENDFDSF